MCTGPRAGQTRLLSARAQAHWPDALVVHRLDMATSGLVLLARNKTAQAQLSQAFAQRQVHKRYSAIAAGALHTKGWQQDGCPAALRLGAAPPANGRPPGRQTQHHPLLRPPTKRACLARVPGCGWSR